MGPSDKRAGSAEDSFQLVPMDDLPEKTAETVNFFKAGRPHEGLSYEQYLAQWRDKTEQPLTGLGKTQRKYLYYARYNYDRSRRVEEAYKPSDRLRRALATLEAPQLWMVLTEDWCVDSAYSLPLFVEAARLSSYITLRLLERDANLDIMDCYLTNGSRSIPKLVAFDVEGEELFQWGPRPRDAQQLRAEMKDAGATYQQISQHLLEWFEVGGWRQTEEELVETLEGLVPT